MRSEQDLKLGQAMSARTRFLQCTQVLASKMRGEPLYEQILAIMSDFSEKEHIALTKYQSTEHDH